MGKVLFPLRTPGIMARNSQCYVCPTRSNRAVMCTDANANAHIHVHVHAKISCNPNEPNLNHPEQKKTRIKKARAMWGAGTVCRGSNIMMLLQCRVISRAKTIIITPMDHARWSVRCGSQTRKTLILPSSKRLHPLQVQPADLLKGRPELRGLVDINLASLLSVRLPELLPNPGAFEAADEYPTLAGQIRRAVQSQIRRQTQLVRMQ